MIKLVHIITSLEIGGAQAVLYDLTTHLDKNKFDHHVIFFYTGPYEKILRTAGIPVYQIHGIISSYDPFLWVRLIRLLKQLKPNYLHTVLWSANFLGRLAATWLNISCVSSLHNNRDQNGTVRNLLDRLIQTNHPYIAVSNEVKESYQPHVRAKTPITVILNGIDHLSIQQQAAKNQISRKELSYQDSHLIIGSVGRLHPIKRYSLLIESFALIHKKHPNVRLLLVGSGNEEKALKNQTSTLGIAHVVTFATNQRAYGYYSLFDCFVLTSHKEGISIALLEAMSYGIPPLVTYHTYQHPVIIHGNNGIVAQTNNATDCAYALEQLIINSSLRNSLGKNAKKSIQTNFTLHKMITAYDHLFRV